MPIATLMANPAATTRTTIKGEILSQPVLGRKGELRDKEYLAERNTTLTNLMFFFVFVVFFHKKMFIFPCL